MTDAQNERTKGRNRRRGRRRGRNSDHEVMDNQAPAAVSYEQRFEAEPVVPQTAVTPTKPDVRPPDIAPPTVRSEEYCLHHMANFTECEPMQTRTGMTTVRHLQVAHFGEATLFCDCLHNGPHEWPQSLQHLETAIELDQFVAASSSAE